MDRAKLYEQLFQAKGDCLTEQQLLDYVYGNLSFEEQHHVEKHLLSCDLCDEAVEGLSLIKEENTQKIIPIIQQNINEITKKRPNYWAWAAIFSGIFVSFLAVFYFCGKFGN